MGWMQAVAALTLTFLAGVAAGAIVTVLAVRSGQDERE